MDSQWSNLDLIYHGILSSVLKLLYCLKKESVISPSPPIVLVILGTICCCWWWFLQSSTRVSAFTLFDLGSLLFFFGEAFCKSHKSLREALSDKPSCLMLFYQLYSYFQLSFIGLLFFASTCLQAISRNGCLAFYSTSNVWPPRRRAIGLDAELVSKFARCSALIVF